MKATHEQTCPRCPDHILPGQVIIPQPRGWTHATCVEPSTSDVENRLPSAGKVVT